MVHGAPCRGVVLGTPFASVLLLLAAPTPAASLGTLRGAGAEVVATAPLVALLALLAWLLAGWLLLMVVVTAGGHLPGAAGRTLSALARRLAPASARRAVEVALGLTAAVGVLGASPAVAASAPAPAGIRLDGTAPGPPPAGVRLDSPAPGPPPAPDLDWAAQVAVARPEVVVRPGDSLWLLAERDLAARGATTTDAAVARAWPRWWAANREAVGDDPHLLQPGTRLTPPPVTGSAPAPS